MTEELLNYFNGDELAASTWLNKYAKRDEHGNIVEQTPADMHRRMAKEFAGMRNNMMITHYRLTKKSSQNIIINASR